MIDEKLLDRMNFGQLIQSLEFVLEKIDQVGAAIPKGREDPRLDRLYVIANKIVVRMNSMVRRGGFASEDLARWNKLMPKYEEDYVKYTDTFLDDDLLLDS